MNLDGRLSFAVRWDGTSVQAVGVESTRAVGASRVLEGKAPAEVARLVPMLFSLCGRAQGVAALRAWEAAMEVDTAPGAETAREWVVAAEAVLETLWRLLLDWPEALGEAPAAAEYVAWRRRLLDLADGVTQSEGWRTPGAPVACSMGDLHRAGSDLWRYLGREVLGMDPAAWEDADLSALGSWWKGGATGTARILARLFAGEGLAGSSDVALMEGAWNEVPWRQVLERTLHETGFAARPDWLGEPRETGALARMRNRPAVAEALARHGNCVAVRVLARLAETVALARGLAGASAEERVYGMGVAPGTGMAWVETSRGVLTHALVLREGRVSRYRMLAPTEWNFHPDGPFVRGLRGQKAGSGSEVERRLQLHAMALDPCVAFDWRVGHA